MIGTKTIFLAQWSHKHGQDISAHKTEKGAFDQCVGWMRECLGEWYAPDDEDHDYYSNMSDEDLFASWTDITDDRVLFAIHTVCEEHMTVETIALNG